MFGNQNSLSLYRHYIRCNDICSAQTRTFWTIFRIFSCHPLYKNVNQKWLTVNVSDKPVFVGNQRNANRTIPVVSKAPSAQRLSTVRYFSGIRRLRPDSCLAIFFQKPTCPAGVLASFGGSIRKTIISRRTTILHRLQLRDERDNQ